MVMIYLVGRIEEIAEACRFGAEVACSTVVPVVYVRVTVASVRCPPVRCRCVGPCKKLACATGLVSCRASRRYRLHGGTVGDTWSCLAVFGTLRATQISGGSSSTVSTIHAEKEKRGRKERCGRATGVWAKGTDAVPCRHFLWAWEPPKPAFPICPPVQTNIFAILACLRLTGAIKTLTIYLLLLVEM
jgi:hypothetical protein